VHQGVGSLCPLYLGMFVYSWFRIFVVMWRMAALYRVWYPGGRSGVLGIRLRVGSYVFRRVSVGMMNTGLGSGVRGVVLSGVVWLGFVIVCGGVVLMVGVLRFVCPLCVGIVVMWFGF